MRMLGTSDGLNTQTANRHVHSPHDERDAPLSWMLALMPDTRLRVRDFQGRWTIVRLNRGDVLVWRGDVEHNGLGYSEMNYRVHGHAYPEDYARPHPALHA